MTYDPMSETPQEGPANGAMAATWIDDQGTSHPERRYLHRAEEGGGGGGGDGKPWFAVTAIAAALALVMSLANVTGWITEPTSARIDKLEKWAESRNDVVTAVRAEWHEDIAQVESRVRDALQEMQKRVDHMDDAKPEAATLNAQFEAVRASIEGMRALYLQRAERITELQAGVDRQGEQIERLRRVDTIQQRGP